MIGGGEVALRQIGQPTLLYFGSPTCSECERTLPDLKPEFDRLAANGVAVFYLSFGDLRRTKMWAAKHSISTADLILVSQQLGHDLDVAGTPFMYALNNQGRIVDRGLLHTIARAQQFAERSTAAPELNLPL